MNIPTEEQVESIFIQLEKDYFFKISDKNKLVQVINYLKDIIKESELKTIPPHTAIWEKDKIGNTPIELPLQILLKGLAVVMYESEAITSLVLKNFLLGEFEILSILSRVEKIITLTETIVLIPKDKMINNFASDYPEIFHKGLARTINLKLNCKNEMIHLLRQMDRKERVKELLKNFKVGWAIGTFPKNHNLERTDNSYEIDIYWNTPHLLSITSMDFRPLTEALAVLVKEEIIEVFLYDKNFKKTGEALVWEFFLKKAKQTIIDNYIKIKVLDYNKLDRINMKNESNMLKKSLKISSQNNPSENSNDVS